MILVIDDDYSVTASLALLLKQAGHESRTAASPDEAMALLDREPVRLVLQDMNFSRRTTGEEGLDLLARIRERHPDMPVILITAWGSIALAVAGMKAGAADFITKPWTNEQILHSLGAVLGLAAVARSDAAGGAALTREQLDERWDFEGIVGRDPKLLAVLDLIGRVAPTDASVLLTGDSGSGKEMLADALHRNSRRARGPFVKVNLGGIPPGLFESEMFGHVRGAFTDAHRDRVGRFTTADGGTIFLDEIGELDPGCQVKLLRVLQDRTFEALGDSRPRRIDVRVVAATNRNLEEAIAEGRFREDLYYRLNLVPARVPSLDERRGDIPLLAAHFLAQAAAAYDRPDAAFDPGAVDWLQRQPWPGNVRQLRHVVERTVLLSSTPRIEARHIEAVLGQSGGRDAADPLPPVGAMTMDQIEEAMIRKSLDHHGGNISRAAESLGLSRPAFYRRLEKYGIPT
jgi:two-component system NtrC family response regulator